MPFNNSYVDPERDIPPDARDKFISLAPQIVREPISTHLIKIDRDGKACFLVVDMAVIPDAGDLVILSLGHGLRVSRMQKTTPRDIVWGTVTWYLKQA